MPLEMPPRSESPFAPWLLNEPTANVLGLRLIAIIPEGPLVANSREWLWFDPCATGALWQGPAWPHGFPAEALDEARARVERRAVG